MYPHYEIKEKIIWLSQQMYKKYLSKFNPFIIFKWSYKNEKKEISLTC